MTYLFTDVEGSTERWEHQTADMSERLARHDEVFRRVLDEHGGYVFSIAGDSYGAAFTTPVRALRAAVAAQRALQAGDVLPVRMGIHLGASEERDGNYFGSAVNRAARLSSAANGGQLVVSATVRAALADVAGFLEEVDVDFRRLGEYRLKDLSRPEEIWQVVGTGLRDDFPPLRTLDVVRHNLPTQRTTLIGRDDDIAELVGLVDGRPITTLLGPGGVGKTRAALAVAAQRVEAHRDGVWLIDLAPVTDPGGVTDAVAMAVGRGTSGLDADAVRALGRQEVLLVLDNCEHVVTGVADFVSALLDDGGPARVLATSQVPLRVVGEQLRRLEPLGWDGVDSAAVALFVDRARSVDPDFHPRDGDAVVEICRRLDGLPLAIEMAAAQVDLLPVADLRDRLVRRFDLLVGSARTVGRHQTLRAAIEWSADLLDDDRRLLFDRLGAFPGPFPIEAVEQVCGAPPLSPERVLPLLADLIRRSLVHTVDVGEDGRAYRLLESIRTFAAESLADRGEHESMVSRLARWCGDWADALHAWHVPPDARTYEVIRSNLDNLSAGVQYALDRGEAALAHRQVLGVASSLVFLNLRLALRWLDRLADLDGDLPPDDAGYWRRRRAFALAQADQVQGRFYEQVARLDALRVLPDGAVVTVTPDDPDEVDLAIANLYANGIGIALPDVARPMAEATRDAYLAIGDERGAIESEVTLSAIDLYGADHASTLARAERFRIEDTIHGSFQVLCALLLAGDDAALLARLDDLGRSHWTFVLDHQADLLRAGALTIAHRFDDAEESWLDAVRVVRRDAVPLCLEECLETCAFMAAERGEDERAVTLLGAFRSAAALPYRTPLAVGMYRRLRSELEARLDADTFRKAWEAGKELGPHRAFELEFAEIERRHGRAPATDRSSSNARRPRRTMMPQPPDCPTMPLMQALPLMQTGDILIFHDDAFESRVIDVLTDSWFSHAAMVYRDPVKGGVYIWQTDPSEIVEDRIGELYTKAPPPDGKNHAGAQLGDLVAAVEETARTWGDQPFWRPLRYDRPPTFDGRTLQCMYQLDATPYPGDLDMLLEFLLGREDIPPRTKDMFCSQLIAATYLGMGILTDVHPDNFYAPRDFSEEPDAELPLMPGASLGPTTKLTLPTS